jgi:LacI family transcriptional regulator
MMEVASMATLREIAKQLGVSTSTVSAVVNGCGYVSPAMRTRIEQALRNAQYLPDENARSLRLGESHTIGLIVPDLTNSFFARLMQGAEDYLASLDYRLLVADTREDWQRQQAYLQSFAARRFAGILLVPCRATDEQTDSIPRLIGHVPLVYVDRSPVNSTASSVLPDNVRAGYAATQHLLELGHRRIGIIGESLSLLTAGERVTGYKKALRAKRVAVDRSLIRTGGDAPDSGYWCAMELFKLAERPTAIVVCNNLLTLALLTAIRDAGLVCPRDISVVGFDDFEWCPHLSPPLSMIRVPAAELGSAAAKVLMKRIRGPVGGPCERVLLPAELIVRQSTCIAPGR